MAETQEESNTGNSEAKSQLIPFVAFLAEYPVGATQKVAFYCQYAPDAASGTGRWTKDTPLLRLNCGECGGIRNFEGKWQYSRYVNPEIIEDFLVYTCRDCGVYKKRYSLACNPVGEGNAIAMKLGEYPELDIKLPTSLPKLLGKDYPYFIKGLKCEKQGLGIGAYSYYRRVVENQKDRLFGEILKVAEKLGAKKEIIQTVQNAIKEVQFTKAVDIIKEALPESLLIDGHNPFKLLHKALSVGIHNQPDEKCLELAHNIRIVLTDLSERIKMALSEKRGLQSAVASLLKFNKKKVDSKPPNIERG